MESRFLIFLLLISVLVVLVGIRMVMLDREEKQKLKRARETLRKGSAPSGIVLIAPPQIRLPFQSLPTRGGSLFTKEASMRRRSRR